MKPQTKIDDTNWRSPLAWALQWPIRLYRLIPRTQERCRFHPTCSAYGLQALRVHGVVRGLYLTIRRVLRCHPWGGMGIDPVPSRAAFSLTRGKAGDENVENTTEDTNNHSDGAQRGTVTEPEEYVA